MIQHSTAGDGRPPEATGSPLEPTEASSHAQILAFDIASSLTAPPGPPKLRLFREKERLDLKCFLPEDAHAMPSHIYLSLKPCCPRHRTALPSNADLAAAPMSPKLVVANLRASLHAEPLRQRPVLLDLLREVPFQREGFYCSHCCRKSF